MAATAPMAPAVAAVPPGVQHLVLVQHGILGMRINVMNLCRALRDALAPHAIVHACVANEGPVSLSGVEVCGERLANEIRGLLQKHRPSHLSLVGFSLGGVLMRYAIASLHAEGRFSSAGSTRGAGAEAGRGPGDAGPANSSDDSMATARPLMFLTVCTPHMGSRRATGGWFNGYWNAWGKFFAGRTGQQLFLEDHPSNPLLHRMATCDTFLEPLSLFEHRVTYANSLNDRLVPFSTSAIMPRNPLLEVAERAPMFPSLAAHLLTPQEGFPHVLAAPLPRTAAELESIYPTAQWFRRCDTEERRQQLVEMLEGLAELPWERVALHLPAHVLSSAHTHAIAVWPLLNRFGLDVVLHIAARVAIAQRAALAAPGDGDRGA